MSGSGMNARLPVVAVMEAMRRREALDLAVENEAIDAVVALIEAASRVARFNSAEAYTPVRSADIKSLRAELDRVSGVQS